MKNGASINELEAMKKMFGDFKNKQNQTTNKKISKEDLLAKYFVPRKTKETFRILPPLEGRKPIEEAFFHVVTTITAGGKKKHGTIIYCPAHNDPKVPKLDSDGNPLKDQNGNPVLVPAPCPLCKKHKDLLRKQDPSIKGIKKENMTDNQLKIKDKNNEIYKDAIKWEAKKFYIVRGIDKGAEKDGVKFWRFKHNYKNQGTLDRLLPIMEDFVTANQVSFFNPKNGTDFNIIMTDSEFNGRTYKAISAITHKGKCPLHNDPVVIEQWLSDDTTWRDVFKPKKAPNVTPLEFLEMVANGTNPYWDDTDPNNKHWVFPGRPDLEEAANTRTQNLDANEKDIEQASDLEQTHPKVDISTITKKDVGTYSDDAVELGGQSINDDSNDDVGDDSGDDIGDDSDDTEYDDLPF